MHVYIGISMTVFIFLFFFFVIYKRIKNKRDQLVKLIEHHYPQFIVLPNHEEKISDLYSKITINEKPFEEFSDVIINKSVLPQLENKEYENFSDFSDNIKDFFNNRAVISCISGIDGALLAIAAVPFLDNPANIIGAIKDSTHVVLSEYAEKMSLLTDDLLTKIHSLSGDEIKNQIGILFENFGQELFKSPEGLSNTAPMMAYLAKDTLSNISNLYSFLTKGKEFSFEYFDSVKAAAEAAPALGHSLANAAENTPILNHLFQFGDQIHDTTATYLHDFGQTITDHINSVVNTSIPVEDFAANQFLDIFPHSPVFDPFYENFGSQALNQTVEAGLQDATTAHFPVITLLTSVARELTIENKKLEDSAKDVALDVSGTFVGGFGGAKAGAAIGSLGGPLGFVIGSILGGITGAIAGRMVTDKIKFIDLNSAMEEYQNQVILYEQEENNSLVEISSGFFNVYTQSQQAVEELTRNKPKYPNMNAQLIQIVKLLSGALDEDLDLAEQYLNNEMDQLFAGMEDKDKKSILFGYPLIDHAKTARKIAAEKYKNDLRSVYEQPLPSITDIENRPYDTLLIYESMPHLENGTFFKSYPILLHELKKTNANILSAYTLWAIMVYMKYKHGIGDLSEFLDKEIKEFNTRITAQRDLLEEKENAVRLEAARVGKDL